MLLKNKRCNQGRTGRGVRGVRLTPLASDSKLRRTVNLRRKKKEKEGKKGKGKRKKRENEQKGENKKEEEGKEEKGKKGKKDLICLYFIVCIGIYTLYRGYGLHTNQCRKKLY